MDGLPDSLIESVRAILEGDSKEQDRIQKAMRKELDKMGADSPADLSDAEKKKLFDKIDRMFVSDKELAGKEDDGEEEMGANDKTKKKKVNEAVNVDDVEEQYYHVDVVNGITGKMLTFAVAANNKKEAEEDVLYAAQDEPELENPPSIGGRTTLVVNSVTEISKEMFDADDDTIDLSEY